MATEPLALPSAERASSRLAHTTGTLLAGVGVISMFGALIAAYVGVRSSEGRWPPRGVDLDNYLGTTLTITMLLGAVTAGWALRAVTHGERGQSLGAFALTLGLGAAFVNGAWYMLSQATFRPGDHAYATLFHTMVALSAIVVAVAALVLLAVMLRVAAHQVDDARPDQARAAVWAWHVAVVAWVAVWAALFLYK